MTADVFLFWLLAIVSVLSAVGVIVMANPIFSALSLVMTMVGIAALFVTLGAYFLAGVQLIVYAGAVMVLFVMVLMLFDLKQETKAITSGLMSLILKLGAAGLFAGMIAGAILMLQPSEGMPPAMGAVESNENIRVLGKLLFTKYLFGFEALGILLLVVAVGAVALARSRGGTHAR